MSYPLSFDGNSSYPPKGEINLAQFGDFLRDHNLSGPQHDPDTDALNLDKRAECQLFNLAYDLRNRKFDPVFVPQLNTRWPGAGTTYELAHKK